MRRVIITQTIILAAAGVLSAQSFEAARAFAFDRGLLDSAEPFAPNGNPALLYQRADFRFYAEWQRTDINSYLIGLSYPLSPRVGLGLAWFTLQKQDVRVLPEAAFTTSFTEQNFLLAIGAGGRIPWGHQVEARYEANRALRLAGDPDARPPFDDDQYIRISYRLGISQPLARDVTLGLITPALATYEYRTFLTSNKPAAAKLQFGERFATRIWTPRFALKWQPFTFLALAFSNRPQEEKSRAQSAAELRVLRNLRGTVALTEGPQRAVVFGLGGYVKGVDAFVAYGTRQKELRMALSFAPERTKELIEARELAAEPVLYPYRLRHNVPIELARIQLRNRTDKPVEILLKLQGRDLPTIKQGIMLEPAAQAFVAMPAPEALQRIPPGVHVYDLEIVAFQRGRQHVQRQFSFEMKESHDWSGESRDLLYFIQPHEPEIVQTARSLLVREGEAQNAPAQASRFYDFLRKSIRYLADPRPLHARQDRAQYAIETLHLRSGDCEDLTILMVSLLESVGIHAAFVIVSPPGEEQGHVLLLFDSSQSPGEVLERDNLQRYVPRQKGERPARLFIPLELTRLDLPFEAAWEAALALYQARAVEQHGLVEGWVKIIDAAASQE